MARLELPSHVVFLGGAGTTIGEKALEQDWFIEAILNGDVDNGLSGNPSDFKAYFVNTDTDETPTDLEERVEKRVDNVRGQMDNPLDIEVQAEVIQLSDFKPELLNPQNVANPQYIPEVMRGQNLDAWWLERGVTVDRLQGLEKNGVDRLRGLTKAIHRLGQSDTDPLSNLTSELQFTNDDPNVAIVVGLGGGTGSGILIDLAYRIINEVGATVDLFASLPQPSGEDKTNEFANTYAALSELEYLALNDRSLFETIHLLPYEAAIDEESFKKAVIYAILSWYNLGNHDERRDFIGGDDNGPPQYAPFTITVPQFLRYVTEDVDETRVNVEAFIEDKSDAIESERELIDELESAIRAIDSDAADSLIDDPVEPPQVPTHRLTDEEAITLREELEELRDFLAEPYLRRIGYRAPGELKDEIDKTLASSEAQASYERDSEKKAAVARDFIDRLPGSIGTASGWKPSDGWEGDEDDLIELCISQFSLVRRRAGILRSIKDLNINEPAVVEAAVKPDRLQDATVEDITEAINPADGGKSSDLRTYIDSIEDSRDSKEDQIAALDSLINDGAPEAVRAETEATVADVESDLQQFYSLYDNRAELMDLIEELQDELVRKLADVKTSHNPDDLPEPRLQFDQFDELESASSNHDDVKAPDRGVVMTAVSNVINAKEAKLNYENISDSFSEKTLQSVKSLISKTDAQRALENWRKAEDHLDTNDIIDLPDFDESFNKVEINDEYFDAGVDDELDSTREEIIDAVRDNIEVRYRTVTDDPESLLPDDADHSDDLPETKERHVDTSIEYVDEWLENRGWGDTLPSSFDDFKQAFKLPLRQEFESVLIQPFDAEKADMNEKVAVLDNALDRYKRVRNARMDEGSEFHSDRAELPDKDELSEYDSSKEPGPFKNEIDPANEGYIGSNQDLGQADIFGDAAEKENVVEGVLNMLPNPESDHFPVEEIYLGHPQTKSYEGHLFQSAFLSTAFDRWSNDRNAQIEELWAELDHPGITKNDYTAARIPGGDDHDFAMTTFLGGVFLDNLSIASGISKRGYEDVMSDTLRDEVQNSEDRHVHRDQVPEIVQRHTYGIDGVTYHDEGRFSQGTASSNSDSTFLPSSSDGGFPYRAETIDTSSKEGKKELLQPTEEELIEMLCTDKYRIIGYPTTITSDADQRE